MGFQFDQTNATIDSMWPDVSSVELRNNEICAKNGIIEPTWYLIIEVGNY